MTLAQQNNITQFPYIITDEKGNRIYIENSNGSWTKREFDSTGKTIYYESSDGYCEHMEYDVNGRLTRIENRYKNSDHVYWAIKKSDDEGRLIYFKDSLGHLVDNRPKSTLHKAVTYTKQKLLSFLTRVLK